MTEDAEVVASVTLRAPVEQALIRLHTRITELLEDWQLSGEFVSVLPPSRLAATITATVQGAYVLSKGAKEQPFSDAIEADLKAQLGHLIQLVTGTDAGRAVRGLIAAAQWDPSVREGFAERYVRPRRAYGAAALDEARERGELRDDTDPQIMIDQLWGACYYRLLTEGDDITTEYTDRLVDQALRGARTS